MDEVLLAGRHHEEPGAAFLADGGTNRIRHPGVVRTEHEPDEARMLEAELRPAREAPRRIVIRHGETRRALLDRGGAGVSE
jgi:hypothetical protein